MARTQVRVGAKAARSVYGLALPVETPRSVRRSCSAALNLNIFISSRMKGGELKPADGRALVAPATLLRELRE